MTPEQAIRILDSDTSLVAIEELKYYAGFNRDLVIEQIMEAMDMGAEAIKKQIPVKPTFDKLFYKCPICGLILLFDDEIPREDGRKGIGPAIENYCSVCGQKIDWKGINDERLD